MHVAIETSARPGSVGLRVGDRVLFRELPEESSHARDLVPTLADLLSDEGRAPRVDAIFVGLGPGSYTGLRVGVATALGLGYAWDTPILGIPSLEVIAFEQLRPNERGTIVLDARGGRFYTAGYERTATSVVERQAPRAVRVEALDELLREDTAILIEPGVIAALELEAELPGTWRAPRPPTAKGLLTLGAQRLERGGPSPPEALDPLYLRAFGDG